MKKVTLGTEAGLAGVGRWAALAGNAQSGLRNRGESVYGPAEAGRRDDARGICDSREESEASQATSHTDADPSIVGLWKTTFTSGGQVVDEGFDQWKAGTAPRS